MNKGDLVRKRKRGILTAVSLSMAFGLVAAACGSSSKTGGSSTSTLATTAAPATTAPGLTTASAAPTTLAPSGGGGGDCAKGPDTSADATNGTNAGWAAWAAACAAAKPLKATGDPIVIGIQNPSGDPAGTFPEYTAAAKAAVQYINNELGGIGADYKTGKPGRPIQLADCEMTITPASSLQCANELASKKPFAVFSTLNFFGNHFPVYAAAKIPVIVGTPITPGDFTSPGVYAIGGGGGCLGVHTGLIEFMTQTLKKTNVAIPWADTPPGVFCYNDLEKKPMNVLNGTTQATSAAYKTLPGLKFIGVPIKPGQADVTPEATKVLDFKPDGIIFSAQGADCWTLVASLAKLGWDPQKTPLVMSGACIDLKAMAAAGNSAKGTYYIGTTPITNPDVLQGLVKTEAQTYIAKMTQYDNAADAGKGFATAGFEGLMIIWELASLTANGNPAGLTADALGAALAKTHKQHAFGGTPISCADAPAPYVATCNTTVTATQWDGTKLNPIRADFSGLYLIAGTKLDLGN